MNANRILVIDDDKGFTEAVCLFLADQGYEVSPALDGKEAMERLHNARIDLAVIDYHLPGEDGDQVARKILEQQPEAPIIMISSDESLKTARGSSDFPMATFLPKPLPPQKLLETIKQILGRYGHHSEDTEHNGD